MKIFFRILILFVVIGLLAWWWFQDPPPPPLGDIDYAGPVADWPEYGGNSGGEKYSPLTQITPQNVFHLENVWTYHTGDVSDGSTPEMPAPSAFEATPILVNDTLYFCTPFNRVIALDPETGKERWVYDPQVDLSRDYGNQLTCRGVSSWQDTTDTTANCSHRIFTNTNDSRLIALDGITGQLCEDFGENGQIQLAQIEDVGEEMWPGEYQITSPPVIINDVVVVGSSISDNQRLNAPSGVVRAYDARTGEPRWAWDLTPPDSTVEVRTPSGYLRGTPNVWAPMSVDANRGLVFLPTGNPTPDYYGVARHGIDYYASSVVALHADSGEVAWHFQTVHHDLWDFDVPAQPTLTEITQDGVTVPVVVQATKMGMLFTLHRDTGESVFPIEERPVPQSTVEGEESSATQPFPLKPPPLVRQTMTPDDAWGLLYFDEAACRDRLASLNFEGMYTPPKVGQGTLMYPGNAGGSNWGGIAVDPARQIVIANVMDLPWVVTLQPAEELEHWLNNRSPGMGIGRQQGAPYIMLREALLSPLGVPCNTPPWGKLVAVDMARGEILWETPLGTIYDLTPLPLWIRYGVPNIGGPLTTASGLTFIGATFDNYLRAFNTETGEELWRTRLPAGGQATPMTYRLSKTGKQYVVIAAGGHGSGGTKLGDALMAFALP